MFWYLGLNLSVGISPNLINVLPNCCTVPSILAIIIHLTAKCLHLSVVSASDFRFEARCKMTWHFLCSLTLDVLSRFPKVGNGIHGFGTINWFHRRQYDCIYSYTLILILVLNTCTWCIDDINRILDYREKSVWFCLTTTCNHILHFHTVLPRRVWPALVLLLFPSTVAAEESSLLADWHDVWLFRFLVNMLGYSTIIIPGYLLICYFKRINYLETGLGLWDTGV